MIELTNVQFAYADGGFGLHVQTICVSEGKQVCWVGPSGSGKTTLLHLVAGIFSPGSGRVTTCGEELTSLQDAARREFRIANIGLVFQDFALLDYLSVLDNILLPYRLSRALQLEPSVTFRAHQLARAVDLDDKLDRRPTQLSQGERQRVAVCRAIVAKPRLLLADEPTANLDAANANRVLDTLEEYATAHGATLVVVSHDRNVLARFDAAADVSTFCAHSQSDGSRESANG